MSKQEEKLIKPMSGDSKISEMSQKEIDKELDSRAVRVNQSMEDYNSEKAERLKAIIQQGEKDEKDIATIQEDINKIKDESVFKSFEVDMLLNLNTSSPNWNSVEGRICAMLGEVQKIERSEKTFKTNSTVAEHISKWIKENFGKYENKVIIQEAFKHAARIAQENYAILPKTENKEKNTAEGAKTLFEGIVEGIKKGANEKTTEYDRRIREMIANDPNDTRLESAKKDFENWTKKEWTEDFKPE